MNHLSAVLLAFGLMSGCGDSTPVPPRPVAQVEERQAIPAVSPAAPTEPDRQAESATERPRVAPEEAEGPPECPYIVIDPRPPLRVRESPERRRRSVGELQNGTSIHIVETNNGYGRIESPVAGWVFLEMVFSSCDAPTAMPALALGPLTYVLLPTRRCDTCTSPEPGTPLPSALGEQSDMSFSSRDSTTLAEPVSVTLVTKQGSCVRRATHRVTLVEGCEVGVEDYATWDDALVVPSCPELNPVGDEAMDFPFVAGVLGAFPDARIEPWPPHEEPLNPGIRTGLQAERRRAFARMSPDERATLASYYELPETFRRLGTSRWGWVSFNETEYVFRDGRVMGALDMTAYAPRRIRLNSGLSIAVGQSGHHGYGFYSFPIRPLPNRAREMAFPQVTCAAY